MAATQAIEIYWRPGCPYCERLFRGLCDIEDLLTLHNIWEDDAARNFVRQHNGGNETVPTVVLAGAVLTNPSPQRVLELLRREEKP